MRHLNKIVFINSASIKYAEIELDGNIHFIGTQGVGKSTLLRAILFFYNADKGKLGIGREKLRFDDYYFKFQNSYIIYEVACEARPYCILAYKHQNRVVFRFIDSAYNKELFIKENNALVSWEAIREALGKSVHYSRLISQYSEYRDIIYGNNKQLNKELRKYAIVQSQQYLNVVRTISNVFLNTNLEASFIKDTIIQSISDKMSELDLKNYSQSHLKDFKSNIEDIRCWSKTDKYGKNRVREQANKVIELYQRLNFIQRQQRDCVIKLNYRMQTIEREEKPLQNNYEQAVAILNAIKREQDEQAEKFRLKDSDIVIVLAKIAEKLETAQRKQKNYEDQDIYLRINQAKEEPHLLAKQASLNREKNLLMAQFKTIEEKFSALINAENQRLQRIINTAEKEQIELKSQYLDDIQTIKDNNVLRLENIRSEYKTELRELERIIDACKENENKAKQKKIKQENTQPFESEINDVSAQLEQVNASNHQAETEGLSTRNQRDTLRHTAERELEAIEREHESQHRMLQNQLAQIKKQIDDETSKLKHQPHSFYHWLNTNKPDWHDNIGKVIDEKLVFDEQLTPKLQPNVALQTLFGVAVSLDHLSSNIKTDDQRERYIVLLKQQKQEGIQKQSEQEENFERARKNTNKRFNEKIAKYNEKITECEFIQSQNQQQIEKLTLEATKWQNKANQEKSRLLQQVEEEIERYVSERLDAESQKERLQAKQHTEIIQQNTRAEENKGKLKEQFDESCTKIKTHIKQQQIEVERKTTEIKQAQSAALQQEGADSMRIEAIDKDLGEVAKRLGLIESNRALIIEYKKDKRELFDCVDDLKHEQSLQIKARERLKKERQHEDGVLAEKHDKQQKQVNQFSETLRYFQEDIQAFEQFSSTETYSLLVATIECDEKIEENTRATTLINKLQDKIFQHQRESKRLHDTVRMFVDNFHVNNIFNFATQFVNDEDFIDFAVMLKEFIEADMVVSYEQELSKKLATVIREIANDTGELLAKEAEVDKIIKNINKDFLNKNFVEAIKEMEMRTQKSHNPIVQHLEKIKAFRDEYDLMLGEPNLFATANSNSKNIEAVGLLAQLVALSEEQKNPKITIADSFELQFRIVENDNDSGWVEKLSHVGSEGTDVLVKAMVNILLLNAFKENVSKKFSDFKLHCMMDEIGRLHPNNVKGILRFANERNILLINGSPTSQNAMDYRHTYKLSKEKQGSRYITKVTKLVTMQ